STMSTKSTPSTTSTTSKFDLTLIATDTGDSLNFHFEYCTKLFKEKTINRFITYFKKILQTVHKAPHQKISQKISDIEIITEAEKNQILYEFNDTTTDYPKDKTIHQLFEEQTEKKPDNIGTVGSRQYAVGTPSFPSFQSIPSTHKAPLQESQSRQIHAVTYRELNKKANTLACILQSKGVKPGTIVAIIAERSIETIIGLMGILKAGAAYLPIDPEYPRERI
ncbi:MAG: AMP-binding protein, partial [bacterium]|nr:AMP-binding protein [bacterium]